MKMIMIMGFTNQLIVVDCNHPIHGSVNLQAIIQSTMVSFRGNPRRGKGLPDLHGIGPTLCSSGIQCRWPTRYRAIQKSLEVPHSSQKKYKKKMSDKEKSITRMNSSSSSSRFLRKFGTNLHQFEHISLEILEFRTMLWSLDMLCSWWFGHVWNIILEMFQWYPMIIMILMAWTYRDSTSIPQNIESKVRVC